MKSNLLVSSACLVVALAACNNDTPTGSLTVPFKIGSANVCSFKNPSGADVPVDDVRIALYRKGTVDSGEPVAEETAPCAEGQALFTTIDAGNYDVVAEGKDADGLVVFDNEGEGSVAEVLEGQDVTADEVRLNLTPAKLQVRWSFSGFEFNQCTQVELETLSIEARRDGGNSPLGDGEFSCDQAADAGDGYHLLVDTDRRLNGNDIDTVEITPRDASGKTIGSIAAFSFDPPGPGHTIKLTLGIECTATNCDLTCAGTPCTPDAP